MVFIGPKKEFQPLNNIVMIKGKFFIKKGFWIILILLVNLLSVFSQTITTPIILSSGGASASGRFGGRGSGGRASASGLFETIGSVVGGAADNLLSHI